MSSQTRIAHLFAMLAVALVFSICAQAGATRTFVSTIGNDSNTFANCGPATPCRTFTAALSITNAGGEIVVLTSGGYGPATISQPVVITAIGVDASISQPTFGQNAITINASGNVTLIGLNLHGEGSGAAGILVTQVGFLRLYNMVIENFEDGVTFDAGGNLEISGSSINDNQGTGLSVFAHASANAYVHNSSFSGSMAGVSISSGHATVADSSAEFNSIGFYSLGGGTLVLENDRVMFNGVGLAAVGNLYFANCFIANNTFWYNIDTGTIAGTNPGTSFIAPGQGTSGTLSIPVTLQ